MRLFLFISKHCSHPRAQLFLLNVLVQEHDVNTVAVLSHLWKAGHGVGSRPRWCSRWKHVHIQEHAAVCFQKQYIALVEHTILTLLWIPRVLWMMLKVPRRCHVRPCTHSFTSFPSSYCNQGCVWIALPPTHPTPQAFVVFAESHARLITFVPDSMWACVYDGKHVCEHVRGYFISATP